ncbi:MAG: hypothetical protein JXK05_04015 [Campylobacterales bacterium]|nr:hypothetical protein [Campylobacterales bacterium]
MRDWIEVFRTGTHTDSGGNTREWTEEDLDAIVSKYDPSHHEAPAVIGHPSQNAPAYAWVEGLKREGKLLLAKFKQIVPEFAEGVESGLWKKRSIALYPDMSLRHVGFLGAQPPAIKGLKDIEFASGDDLMTIEFSQADPKESDAEAKIKALEAALEASKESLSQMEVMFAETQQQATSAEEARKKLETELAAIRNETRAKEREVFVDTLVAQGKLTPALRQMAIDMVSIADAVGMYAFAEGEASATEKVESFLSALPKVIEFGEMAPGASEHKVDSENPKALADAALEFKESEKKAGRDISIARAVQHVKGAKHV